MSSIETASVTKTGPGSTWRRLRAKARAWYWASRPFTLSGSVVPVLVGSALALQEGMADPVLFVLMLVAAVLVQATTNMVDEYSDHSRPEGKHKLLAPHKVIALGLLSVREVKAGALICTAVAAAIGLYMVSIAGWPVLAICLAGAAVAYLYAAGPRALRLKMLGHPLVFLFMGPGMVLGAYYIYSRAFTLEAILLSLAVGCTVTAILVANDLRDMEEDAAARKPTPVTVLGRGFGRWEWALLVAAAFLAVVASAAAGALALTALLSLLALPRARNALKAVWRAKDRPAAAQALRASGGLHGWFGLLLAVGVALGRLVL